MGLLRRMPNSPGGPVVTAPVPAAEPMTPAARPPAPAPPAHAPPLPALGGARPGPPPPPPAPARAPGGRGRRGPPAEPAWDRPGRAAECSHGGYLARSEGARQEPLDRRAGPRH